MPQHPTAKKSLGQHFLADPNIIRKIVEAINPQKDEPIIEIGPGPAVLTQPLLASNCNLHVVEIDPRMVEILQNLQAPNLTIHHTDALKTDLSTLAPTPCKLVGNLPYNVGTQIVFNAINAPYGKFSEMVFMLQKEVIDRILAKPNTKDYGRLAIWCDLLTERKKLFDVPPGAFRPPPKVMSSVARLIPREKPLFSVNVESLNSILTASFTQRRKMLRASLKGLLTEAQIEAAGIPPTARPETLTTEQFCALAALLP